MGLKVTINLPMGSVYLLRLKVTINLPVGLSTYWD